MSESSKKVRICLSREIEGNTIQVWIENEAEFSAGFRLLQKLCEQTRIEQMKLDYEPYWHQNGDAITISDSVSEGPVRVALSLFSVYPQCKRPLDIQNETGLASGSVSNILVGRKGNLGSWFTRCENGWKISKEGVERILAGELLIKE